MKSWVLGICVAAACSLAGASAFGASVTLQSTGSGLNVGGISVAYKSANGATTYDSYSGNIGQYTWNVTSGASNLAGSPSAVSTFCIQLGQSFSFNNSYTFDATTPTGGPAGGNDKGFIDAVAAGELQLLTDKYFLSVGGAFNVASGIYAGSYNANEVAAAFQLSIWEIEYNAGSDGNKLNGNGSDTLTTSPDTFPTASAGTTDYLGSGQFTASASNGSQGAAAIKLADFFLNTFAVGKSSSQDNSLSSIAFESPTPSGPGSTGTAQDQYWGQPNSGSGNISPTPLPASLPAGLTLLAGLAAFRKFRKSRA